MAQIQRQQNRVVNGKAYHKNAVVIPPSAVEKSGLRAGETLRVEATRGKITIRR